MSKFEKLLHDTYRKHNGVDLDIAIKDKREQLEWLNDVIEQAKKIQQPPASVSYAEQAAKEIGAMTDEEFANLHKPPVSGLCDHPWDSVIGGEMKPA